MTSEKSNTNLNIRENFLNDLKIKSIVEEEFHCKKNKKKIKRYPLEKTVDDIIEKINIILKNEVSYILL
jgi:hypothetical protein